MSLKNPGGPLPASVARNRRKRSRALKVIASAVAVLVGVGAVGHFCGDAFLNRFLRPKLEQALSAHLPGSILQMGGLRYSVWRNRVMCDAVAVTPPGGAPARARAMVVTGVPWHRLFTGKPNLTEILRHARLELTDFSAMLPGAGYRVAGGHLGISVPDAELTAQGLSLEPVANDDAFFASDPFRRVRYRLAIAACSLRGVGFAEVCSGQAYRAKSIEVIGPVIETLVNRDKPRRPLTENPPTPQQVLAALTQPFRIDRLTITGGLIKIASRRFEGAEPGVLTFTAVRISAQEIANAAAGGAAIGLLAEGRLMDAGTMTVQMRIPVAASGLAFHYSGKLSAMDLTRLDEYMDGSGRIQIKSGSANETIFDIDVVDGHARGALSGAYRDLQVTVVDAETGSEKGVANRVATLLANHVMVKSENSPDKAGTLRAGKIDYIRKPEETFLMFAWLALRTGVLELVSTPASPIPAAAR